MNTFKLSFLKGVTLTKHGVRTIRIDTDIGLTVQYDGVYNVFVTLSARYRGRTAGLCGNYNGNNQDEFVDVNFQKSHTILHFAQSWNVDRSCANEPSPGNPCLTAGSVAQQAKKKCLLLRQQPFAKCHNSVNQDSGFIKDCEYDVCSCDNHPSSCLCEEFAAYATSCSLVGVPITWRNLAQFAECSKCYFFLEFCIDNIIGMAVYHQMYRKSGKSILLTAEHLKSHFCVFHGIHVSVSNFLTSNY